MGRVSQAWYFFLWPPSMFRVTLFHFRPPQMIAIMTKIFHLKFLKKINKTDLWVWLEMLEWDFFTFLLGIKANTLKSPPWGLYGKLHRSVLARPGCHKKAKKRIRCCWRYLFVIVSTYVPVVWPTFGIEEKKATRLEPDSYIFDSSVTKMPTMPNMIYYNAAAAQKHTWSF